MRIRLVRLEKGEFDVELLLAGIALAAMVGILALRWVPPGLIPLPRCAFHALTGQPCLTCGGTRAARALSRLDLVAALRANPLVASALIASGPLALWGLAAWTFKLPRPRLEAQRRGEQWALRLGALALVAGNWAYLIVAGI